MLQIYFFRGSIFITFHTTTHMLILTRKWILCNHFRRGMSRRILLEKFKLPWQKRLQKFHFLLNFRSMWDVVLEVNRMGILNYIRIWDGARSVFFFEKWRKICLWIFPPREPFFVWTHEPSIKTILVWLKLLLLDEQLRQYTQNNWTKSQWVLLKIYWERSEENFELMFLNFHFYFEC